MSAHQDCNKNQPITEVPVEEFDAFSNGGRPRHLWEMGIERLKVDFQLPEGLGRVSLAICTSPMIENQ